MEGIAKLIATLSANPGKLATALEIVVAAFKALRRMWWNITGKTSASEHPVCPHCGAVDEEWIDSQELPLESGVSISARCRKCQGVYYVRPHFPITFDTHTGDERGLPASGLVADLLDCRGECLEIPEIKRKTKQ